MWESNPPSEVTRFLYLPSWVRTDDLQNYSLTLYQLSYWPDQMQEHEKFFKNEERRDAHAQSQMKSMQNNHIKDFPNHLPYLIIFHYTLSMTTYNQKDITLGDFPNHLPYLVIFHHI